jgi:bifunctional DNA-binding transcriptional regulator/antitoxin component of YhaV-PrlF toxin-antitoxin module
MARLAADLQVTIPKALAERFDLRPGDEVEWVPREEGLQVMPMVRRPLRSPEERLALFEQILERQRARDARRAAEPPASDEGRGWTREDLYDRARPR